jgi:hypothetical protein
MGFSPGQDWLKKIPEFLLLRMKKGGESQTIKPYILKNHFSSLFFFDRVPCLFPSIPATFKGVYRHIALFNEVTCRPGTGSLIFSAAVKY